MPANFVHRTLAQRVVFASGGASDAVAAEVQRRGARRILVIASARQGPVAQAVCAGVRPVGWFDGVTEHVPSATAEKARAAAASVDADLLVSVGGGSATGLAKAVALTNGVPILAVPTTYAGSEATNVWGITDDRTKRTGVDDRVLPETVVYDAALTSSLPVGLSVASGLNALAHCVDSLWAPHTDPLDTALALEGAAALAGALHRLVENPTDLDARQDALYGSHLAAVAFASAGSGLHHKICHVLGGTFDLPHAHTHAVVLPHVLALIAPAVPGTAVCLARALGEPAVGDGDASGALERLLLTVGAARARRPRSHRRRHPRSREPLSGRYAAVQPSDGDQDEPHRPAHRGNDRWAGHCNRSTRSTRSLRRNL